MEFRYIEEFVLLAENCSYIDTAQQMFISEAALSKHIKQLEAELGVTLFERTSRKVKLNSFGTIFSKYASEILNLYARCKMELEDALSNSSDNLTIGSVQMNSTNLICDAIIAFKKQYPNIHIMVKEGSAPIKMLEEGQCNVAFSRILPTSSKNNFESMPYLSNHLVAILPKSHPLAGMQAIDIGNLRNDNFILMRPSYTTDILLRLCHSVGFDPHVEMYTEKSESIFKFVGNGFGISFLGSRQARLLKTDDVTFSPILPNTMIDLHYLYPKETAGQPAALLFTNFIRNYVKKITDVSTV